VTGIILWNGDGVLHEKLNVLKWGRHFIEMKMDVYFEMEGCVCSAGIDILWKVKRGRKVALSSHVANIKMKT
jgi:hypothetical protein